MSQIIIPPKEGWVENTVYLVDVSFNPNNPVHSSLFFTGFLNGKGATPGGYNKVWNHAYDPHSLSDVYFLRAVKVVVEKSELRDADYRLPDDLYASIVESETSFWQCDLCDSENDTDASECDKCGEVRKEL